MSFRVRIKVSEIKGEEEFNHINQMIKKITMKNFSIDLKSSIITLEYDFDRDYYKQVVENLEHMSFKVRMINVVEI